MISARDAALSMAANMASAGAQCAHQDVVPVELVITGETVAHLCARCLCEVPNAWGCTECEWIELSTLGQLTPQLILGTPCAAHRDGWRP